MIYIYRFLINIIIILSPLIILIRLLKKKEDIKRFKEKFSFFSKKRKTGKLIWFHTASVGELLSIVSLIKSIEKNKKISQILVTTTTLTSSKLFKKFKFKKTIHQFFPIDNNTFTKKFLNYWNPSIAIFVESEIWPNMIKNLEKKSIMKILLNARISKKSYKRWKLLGSFSKDLFQSFNFTLPQNTESKIYLNKLGAKKIKFLGNLKFAQNNLYNNSLDYKFKKFTKTKKFWCALSTHPGEEDVCSSVQVKLLKKFKNLVLVIIPRHVERVKSLSKELSKFNLRQHIHSDNRLINKDTKIYIVDAYGETSSFLEMCKIVFMGKSLTTDGGQNPLEAARDNCSILHGPRVSNFSEIYEFLDKEKISFKIKNQKQLYKKLEFLLSNKNKNFKIKNRINKIGNVILLKNLKVIESLV